MKALAGTARTILRNIEHLKYEGRQLVSSRASKPGSKTRMLLISDGREYTSEQQFAPIVRHAALLRQELGLDFVYVPLEVALKKTPSFFANFEIIGLKLSFRLSGGEALSRARHFRALCGPATTYIYFDGDDDSNIQWPAVLDEVDLYVKKHAFVDPLAYQREYIGKNNLTDYVAKVSGRSFADNAIATTGAVPAHLLKKLHVAWNIGLDDKIAELGRASMGTTTAERPVDVSSRAIVAPDNWIYSLRNPVAQQLESMADEFNVSVPRARVAPKEYYEEMRSSKICVSPFGYGELCWRDFEAIMSGCLLVKADMSHVRTAPDIFIPYVTYVPVAWDYSNLREVCREYLANTTERQRIISQAQAAVTESLTSRWFIERMAELLAASQNIQLAAAS